MKIYVAASSTDLERAEKWMTSLRESGLDVTSDWVEIIRAAGEANPRGATDYQRLKWSDHDLEQLDEAEMVWFLVPSDGSAARGAYFEIGYAVSRGMPIISSGDTKQSIFTAQGRECATDGEAFLAIMETHRQLKLRGYEAI